MNLQAIIRYYLKDVPKYHYSYQVFIDAEGVATLGWYFCSPEYDRPQPTPTEMGDMEAEAVEWYTSNIPTTISYYDFWELLPLPLQISVSNEAERLRRLAFPNMELTLLIGKTQDPTNRIDLANPAVTGAGGYFEVILAKLVENAVLTQAQADMWAVLEAVTI